MFKAQLDYKKELEAAARSMILIHDPQTLIKLIVRMIVGKVRIQHSGIMLYNKAKDSYILTVSRGASGLKIPAGFARVDPDNPLICFFAKGYDKKILDDGTLSINLLARYLKNNKSDSKCLDFVRKVMYQLEIFDAAVCVPIFFRDSLLGILLLGKKEDHSSFKRDDLDFFSALASDVAMAIRNAQLFEELKEELEKRHRLFIHTTVALAAAIDAKDHYTHGHTSRVTNYCLAIAEELRRRFSLDKKFMDNLQISSLLHDIGKIGIPEKILNKRTALKEEEMKIIRQHPLIGVTILEPIKELNPCLPAVKYHHEKYDGSGYPEGLKGKQIPLAASIIAVADSFDAITSERPYRRGFSRAEAIAELARCSGSQFDPKIVKAAQRVFSG